MDKKLLDALNNLSEALDLIAQALSEKDSAQSPTAKALEAGNFVNQIKEINEGIKKLQADNQKIIKNQETILALSKKKENEKKTELFRNAGDKDMQKLIKTGVSVVLIIAAGVLAIGMAFKLIGKVDFLSVVGLSLAIVLIAVAFEKIAKLKMSIKEVVTTSLILTTAAASVTAASWILSMIRPISFAQALTAIGIAGMFTFIAPAIATLIKSMESEDEFEYEGMKFKSKGLKFSQVLAASAMLPMLMSGVSLSILASSYILSKVKPLSIPQALTAIGIGFVFALIAPAISALISGMISEQEGGAFGYSFKSKGISWNKAIVAALALPLVMTGITIAITSSSYILSKIKPISLMQGLTAILISGVFAVLALGIKKIISAFGGSNALVGSIVAATLLPVLFVAISYAIMMSSYNLAKIQPIKFDEFATALGISMIFVVLSFAMSLIFKTLGNINPTKAIMASISMPILFIGLSMAIMYSSEYLSKTTPVDNGLLFNIVVMSIALAITTIAISSTIWIMDKMGFLKNPVNFLIGSAFIILTAGVIMASSLILNIGTYENYPDWNWAFGVGLSIIAFSISMVFLGAIAMTGIGFLAMSVGGATVLLVATTIVGTSYILASGNYSNYPTPDWSMGVGLSLFAFGMSMVGLGAFILGTLGFGYLALKAGSKAVLTISETIVEAASILSEGKFEGGPTKEWAEGISLALGSFAPIYHMLISRSIISSIFGGGVSVDDFKSAIITISEGIVTSAKVLGKNPGIWKDGPSEEWAKGVSTAIGAFAPVYTVLSNSKGIFSRGPSIEEMKSAIKTISKGIVEVANFFGDNITSFDLSKVPSKEWGERVGSAIQAFMPALNFISDNDGVFSSGTYKLMNGIMAVTNGIVTSSHILSFGKFTTSIPPDWVESISGNIRAYVNLSNYITDNYKSSSDGIVGKIGGILFGSNNQMDSVISGLTKLGIAYDSLSESIKNFGNSINEIDAEKLSMIKAFTSNVVLMSLMDPDAFEEMLDKLEEKAGIFANIISDINSSTEQGNKSITSVKAFTTNTPETEQTQQKILQILSNMDAKLGLIAINSSTLADYTNELRTGQGVKIKK